MAYSTPQTPKSIRLPIYGTYYNRYIDPTQHLTMDQYWKNCYPVSVDNVVTNNKTIYAQKRPGSSLSSTIVSGILAGNSNGIVWTGNTSATKPAVISYFGTSGTYFYDMSSGTATQIGSTIASTSGAQTINEGILGGTAYLLANVKKSSGAGYDGYYYAQSGSWTRITDTDFPANNSLTIIGQFVVLNGYAYIMCTTGDIYNSNLNDIVNWSATDYLNAQLFPDGGSGLARYKNTIAAFGKYSVEFFYDNANETGTPLAPMSNAVKGYGAIPQQSGYGPTILEVGDTVYWMGIEQKTGARGVYCLDESYGVKKVSTNSIDRILNVQNLSVGFIGTLTMDGMTHLVLDSLPTANTQFAYCIDQDFWWILGYNDGTSTSIESCVSLGTWGAANFAAVSSKVATIGPNTYSAFSTYQDNSTNYDMIIQTSPVDVGTTKRKFWKELAIVSDELNSSYPNVAVSWSDDDYGTWSTARNVDTTSDTKNINGLGSSRRRAFKLTHSGNCPVRIEAIELDFDIGNT